MDPARQLRLATTTFSEQEKWDISVFSESRCPSKEATTRQ